MEYETRQDMIKSLNLKGHVAEIGVFRGEFADDILKLCPNITKLTLVDIWEPANIASGDQDGNNMKCYSGIDNYQTVLSKYFQNTKVRIIRDDSVSYLSTLRDNILDAIYIDADHSYEGCLRDLESAYRVVKDGGYIMGHDYKITSKCQHDHVFGVGKAVDELCKKYNLSIYALGMDGCASYAIKK